MLLIIESMWRGPRIYRVTWNSSVIAKSSLASSREKIVPVSVSVKRVFVAIWLLHLLSLNEEKKKRCEVLQLVGSKTDAQSSRHSLQECFKCWKLSISFFRRAVLFKPESASAFVLKKVAWTLSNQVRLHSSTPQSQPNHLSCLPVSFPHLCIPDSPN